MKKLDTGIKITMKKQVQFASYVEEMWRLGVVVIATAQLHLTKAELRLCAGSKPTPGVSGIRDGEDP